MQRYDDPAHLLDLEASFDAAKDTLAARYCIARLQRIRATLESAILQGERAPDGRDLTPEMRSAYGILLQIMAIPLEIAQRKQLTEEELMHYRQFVADQKDLTTPTG